MSKFTSSVCNQPKPAGMFRWGNLSSYLVLFNSEFTFLHFGTLTGTTGSSRFSFLAIPGIIQTSQSYPLWDQGSPQPLHMAKPASRSSWSFTVLLGAVRLQPCLVCCAVFSWVLSICDEQTAVDLIHLALGVMFWPFPITSGGKPSLIK